MLKKLSENRITEILETGISEFAARGPDRASMNDIAHKSGVSVGVLYKYYENKDAFFLACLRHALRALEQAIGDALKDGKTLMERAELLIRAVQRSARRQPSYHILYHEVTAGGCRRFAPMLAQEIEGISARTYTAMIRDAQRAGEVRADLEPSFFAFFFDSLLTILQFSYSCTYYRERFKVYCGADAALDDERVAAETMRFFRAAFMTDRTANLTEGDGET